MRQALALAARRLLRGRRLSQAKLVRLGSFDRLFREVIEIDDGFHIGVEGKRHLAVRPQELVIKLHKLAGVEKLAERRVDQVAEIGVVLSYGKRVEL